MDAIKMKHEIESAILKKIGEDEHFEKQLLSDPHAALKTIGVVIPKEVKVKIVHEEKGELVLVVPHRTQGTEELTDLELRYSSGGKASSSSWKCLPGTAGTECMC